MSFGFGFGSGLKALNAARLAIQTAGNNIANANTPGFSRQRVELASAMPYTLARGFQMGMGVEVSGLTRLVDDSLESRIRMQLGLSSGADVDYSRYREIEGIFAEPDNGISARLSSLFGSVGALQTDPADRALRGGLIQSGGELAQGLNLLSSRLGDLASGTFDEVRGLVRTVNEHAGVIAELNLQITSLEANGSSANDLRDTREQHIKEISKLVDTRALSRSSGAIDIVVAGHLLVGGGNVSEITVAKGSANATYLSSGNNTARIPVTGGRIAALLRHESKDLPGLSQKLDSLAYSLALETNRIHTTGLPRSGPFSTLTSFYGAADGDNDGVRGDEFLSEGGFQFAMQAGDLYMSVVNRSTGEMERTRLRIDPNTMSLQDLADEISAIEHVNASVDPTGRLRITADGGYGFDFSPRLDPNPDTFGSFGGQNPSIGSGGFGPFDLSGQTFPVSFTVTTGTAALPTATTVTLDATDFNDTSRATAAELAAAINNDLGSAGAARDIGGRLVIRSNSGGSTSQLALTNVGPGTVLTDLGMSTATTFGQDTGVSVQMEGTYTGTENDHYVFVPASDGEIGVTDNLRVNVYDRMGNLVGALNVGRGYTPGEALEVGDGVSVRFGPGSVSASAGHVFGADVLADSDTTDVLVALGMNSFFHGSTAENLAVNADLVGNPDLVAGSLSLASGDAGNLSRWMAMRDRTIESLDSNKVEDFYGDMVGDLGFETASAEQVLASQDLLLQHLDAERESVSGVNIDEEMVDLMRHQQVFEAATRYLGIVQEMTTTLINLGGR